MVTPGPFLPGKKMSMKLILPLLLLVGCGHSEPAPSKKDTTILSTFGIFPNHHIKFTTTRCIEWEKDDSVGGYMRTNNFEFIITPDPDTIDTVVYNGEKIIMWADRLAKHKLDDGTYSNIISFWPPYIDNNGPVPGAVNYNYDSHWVTLWHNDKGLLHISMGGKSPVRNKHTVYTN